LFPQGVNWDAALAGLDYPDVPSHESNMPNFFEAEIVIDTWEDRLTTEMGMDAAAAAEELRVALDPVFGGAPAPTVPGTEPAGTEPAGTEPATTSG
jgi:multiple sugar transport system substrate-binding protein